MNQISTTNPVDFVQSRPLGFRAADADRGRERAFWHVPLLLPLLVRKNDYSHARARKELARFSRLFYYKEEEGIFSPKSALCVTRDKNPKQNRTLFFPPKKSPNALD
jgi:hypothetical protein